MHQLTIAVLLLTLAPIALARAEVVDEAPRVVLRTDVVEVVLDKGLKGAVTSLRDRTTGREFAAQTRSPRIFWLAFSRPGDASGALTWADSASAQSVDYAVAREGDTETARMTFRGVGRRGLSAVCEASVREGDEQVAWRIRVESAEAIVLEEVAYPVIALRAPLEGDGEADRLAAGLTKGGVFRNPSQWAAGTTLYARQPGELAAQFGCCYGPAGGVYTAGRDAKGYPKALQFKRIDDAVELAWRFPCFAEMPGAFEPGCDVATTAFRAPDDESTDWRHAADIYKRWALEQPWCSRTLAERDDLPDWLREGPAMVRFNREWLATPGRIESWLRDYWKACFPRCPLIFALWGWEGPATWVSPDYFPPYPSEEGLARIVKAARDAGGHPFFWPSGYHWTVTYGKRPDGSFEWDDREDFRTTGLPHAVLNRDGSPWTWDSPWLRGGSNRSLCRGDAWTRDWLNDIAVELVKRGADMIQVDQVVGGLSTSRGKCYSREHGHPPGEGLWDTEAFFQQLDSMREACRRLDPNVVLGIEEPQELCIQQVGIQDYRDSQPRYGDPKQDERTSVFGYLYHEFVPCFQSNPSAADLRGMMYCLVGGQVPHLVPHWPLEPSPALRNGSLEAWDGDVPEGWEHVKGYRGESFDGRPFRDESAAHGGGSSLRLVSEGDGDIAQVSQNVPIGPNGLRPGARHRFALWHRGTDVREGNQIILGAFDAAWSAKGVWQVPVTPSEDWRLGVVEFTMPEAAVQLRIMLHIVGRATVWIDDVALDEEIEPGEWRTAMLSGLPPTHDAAVRWVELFCGGGRPYLLLGRMVHPPRLDCERTGTWNGNPEPAVLHNAYRAADGTEAVVAANATGSRQACVLHWRGRERRLSFEPWEINLITD